MKSLFIDKLKLVLLFILLTQLASCDEHSSDDDGFTQNISLEIKSNHIKALFFGTGPYAYSNNNSCPVANGRWASFPQGSLVEVIVPKDTTDDDYQLVVEEMDRINTAVAGYFTTIVVQSEKSDLTNPKDDQITFNIVNSDVMNIHCPGSSGGCIEMEFYNDREYLIKSGVSFYPASRGIFDIHELGHGIGLCDVNPQAFPEGTMASAGGSRGVIARFSDSELAAINYVFTSGLDAGSTEQEFWDAGLLP